MDGASRIEENIKYSKKITHVLKFFGGIMLIHNLAKIVVIYTNFANYLKKGNKITFLLQKYNRFGTKILIINETSQKYF